MKIDILDPKIMKKISRKCPQCGVDDYSYEETETGYLTKEIHRKDCKLLPIIFGAKKT